MSLDIPQHRVSLLIDSLLWQEQPLGRDIAGSKESVASIGRAAMLAYMARQYRAGSMVACVAGNVIHEDVCNEVAGRCRGLVPGRPDRVYKVDGCQVEARIGVDRRDGEQAHICLGVHGVSRLDERRFAVDALNVVLGGGMSSRLFTEIREKRGLAYDIHSYVEHFVDAGSLVVYAGVDPSRAEECIRAVVEELSKLREPVGEVELRRAKELSKGRLELRLEDTQNVALWHGAQELLNGEILSADEVARRIEAVTAEDIASVAREFLSNKGLNLAVVGPVTADLSGDLFSM